MTGADAGALVVVLIGLTFLGGLVAVAFAMAAERIDRIAREREARRLAAKYRHLRAVDLEAPRVYWPESPTEVATESFRDYYTD